MKDMNYVYMSTSMEALCRHVNKNKSHPPAPPHPLLFFNRLPCYLLSFVFFYVCFFDPLAFDHSDELRVMHERVVKSGQDWIAIEK